MSLVSTTVVSPLLIFFLNPIYIPLDVLPRRSAQSLHTHTRTHLQRPSHLTSPFLRVAIPRQWVDTT